MDSIITEPTAKPPKRKFSLCGPRKTPQQLVGEEIESALKGVVQSALDANCSELTITIKLPHHRRDNYGRNVEPPVRTMTFAAQFPTPYCAYEVIESGNGFYHERGRADTFDEAEALIESIQGTQPRGWVLQILGYNEDGYTDGIELLKYPVRRGK